MKKILVIGLAILATGCSNNKMIIADNGKKNIQNMQEADLSSGFQTLKKAPLCCDSLSELNYQIITEAGKFDFVITPQNEAFNFTTGKSFVKGIALPVVDGTIKMTLSSPIAAGVFVPTLLILDEQHKALQRYSEETIKYDSASLLKADRLFADIEFPAVFADGRRAKYLLVLTTEEAMQSTTKLAPQKQLAAEVGRADLFYKTQPIAHTATGVVRLTFDYTPGSRNLATRIVTEAPNGSQKAQVKVAAQSITATVATEAGAVINNSIQPESEAMFLTLIEQAVKDGDYEKALRLVKQAERAGSAKALNTLLKYQ
ncbi:hypothetical protein Ping_0560 [Psychromonas ingrahamii 37]|uniref:Maltose operon periplasmic n=1 Tax=Psychromonas ingrahamii (strain DSM 17664 / CCUG 51855 / 37) TaxID=357804 RepID=A1SSE9_PSYIN|nr:MalM family protein [Psychromonas ingrahamii]ABM02414.1 hypothetical protein Ping_0560 [Psychromonas ingrahamii 37]